MHKASTLILPHWGQVWPQSLHPEPLTASVKTTMHTNRSVSTRELDRAARKMRRPGEGTLVSLGDIPSPMKPQAQTGGRVPPTALQECTGQQEKGRFLQPVLRARPGEGTSRTQKGRCPRWERAGPSWGRGQ